MSPPAIWFRLVLLTALLSWNFAAAAELIAGPHISFTNHTQPVIQWKTDVSTATRVFFGKTPQTMSRRADGEQGLDHLAILPSLEPGTKWHYTIGTARVALATNSFEVPGAATSAAEEKSSITTSQKAKPPPARETWGYLPSLRDHFERHGADFNAKDPEDYARLAWEFRQRALNENLPAKVDSEGVMRIYDPRSGAFAAYNKNGTTKTFFKPRSRDYFERQPGKLLPRKGVN